MWVFSRKKGESLVINDNIVITIIEIRGDKVRLGIEHPHDVPVHRQEVYDAIRGHDAPTPILAPPKPHIAERSPDTLDRLTAALQARLSVHVDRELVTQALREAGIEAPDAQPTPK